jgi:hypothetical protein
VLPFDDREVTADALAHRLDHAGPDHAGPDHAGGGHAGGGHAGGDLP